MTIEEFIKLQPNLENLPEWFTAGTGAEMRYFRYSHESLTPGYVKKHDKMQYHVYAGRFGTGFTILARNPRSTRYCYKCYYIEKAKEDFAKYVRSAFATAKDVCDANYDCDNCPMYHMRTNTCDYPPMCKDIIKMKMEV